MAPRIPGHEAGAAPGAVPGNGGVGHRGRRPGPDAPAVVGEHERVLIFLPPSEAKSSGGAMPPVRGLLGRDELGRTRRRVLSEVANLTRRDPDLAAAALKVPAGAVPEAVGWNRDVLVSPTRPALERYAGVVFAALDPATLTAAQLGTASRSVRIFSGGFGVVRGDEPVPAYRIPAAARLPGVGGLTALWKPVLRNVVAEDVGNNFVVDLRSSDYAALWTPPAELRDQVLTVRVLTRRRTARGVVESVISYNSKHVKGLLARSLVVAATRGRFRDVHRVVSVLESAGYEVRERRGTVGGWLLDVVEDVTG